MSKGWKYLKYFNIWFFWCIIIIILIFLTNNSNANPEYKITWLLLELILFMFSYRFWELEIRDGI